MEAKKLPPVLAEEMQRIVQGHRNPRTGEPMTKDSRKNYLLYVRLLQEGMTKRYPERRFESLVDFQAQDLPEYKRILESQENGAMKGITIWTRLLNLKGVFGAAFDLKIIPENIAKDFEVRRPAEAEQYRRCTPEEVKRLCAIDEKKLEALDLRGKFQYLRNKAMAAVQKDAALRASEVMQLSEADIRWDRQSAGGHVPIVIRESKGRARGHEDTTYLSPWGVGYIKRYLVARDAYLESRGLTPGAMKSAKSDQEVGSALFVSQKNAAPITPDHYEEVIFPELVQDAKLPDRITSHFLRHSQISEWVEAGMDPKRVQRLARHKSMEMTLRYYHFNEKELVGDLDRRFGTKEDAPTADFKRQLLPEKPVRMAIIEHTLKGMAAVAEKPLAESLDSALESAWKPEAAQGLYYAVHEACAKLKIKRTQLYVGWIRAGYLHPQKIGPRTVFLKAEVDTLAALRTSEEASAILGYKEKVPVTVAHLAAQGILEGRKVCGKWRFTDKALTDFLLDKRLGRIRLVARLRALVQATPTYDGGLRPSLPA